MNDIRIEVQREITVMNWLQYNILKSRLCSCAIAGSTLRSPTWLNP